ncbi:MAG: Rab family GTPase [Candidatus Thorarchaeota archaeon]
MLTRPTIFKTILVGEGGVGKTSILVRFTENRFDENMKMTIGTGFASRKMAVNGSEVTLIIWDLSGQPRFHDVVQDYFRGSRAAILVFDASRYYTLENLNEWMERVRSEAPDCITFVVANKCDVLGSEIGANREDAIAFASRIGADFFEVSAKTGQGISELFTCVASTLAQRYCQ